MSCDRDSHGCKCHVRAGPLDLLDASKTLVADSFSLIDQNDVRTCNGSCGLGGSDHRGRVQMTSA